MVVYYEIISSNAMENLYDITDTLKLFLNQIGFDRNVSFWHKKWVELLEKLAI